MTHQEPDPPEWEDARTRATAHALRLLILRAGTPARVGVIISALAQALEACGDPHLQRQAADMLRAAADRLRP